VIASDHSIPTVVVVMIMVSVLVYPQHAFDTANYATGHPADSTAHDPADRSGRSRCGLLAAHPLQCPELAPKEAL